MAAPDACLDRHVRCTDGPTTGLQGCPGVEGAGEGGKGAAKPQSVTFRVEGMAPHLLGGFLIDGSTGCWLWQKSKSKDGYGWASFKNKTYQAHRLFYILIKGPIPDGLVLDHVCRCRHCVNPEHLEPVTPQENLKRSVITPLGRGCCLRCGGQFSLIGKTKPQRRCLPCSRLQRRTYNIKNKDRLNTARREWEQANIEKRREYGRRSDAKRRSKK